MLKILLKMEGMIKGPLKKSKNLCLILLLSSVYLLSNIYNNDIKSVYKICSIEDEVVDRVVIETEICEVGELTSDISEEGFTLMRTINTDNLRVLNMVLLMDSLYSTTDSQVHIKGDADDALTYDEITAILATSSAASYSLKNIYDNRVYLTSQLPTSSDAGASQATNANTTKKDYSGMNEYLRQLTEAGISYGQNSDQSEPVISVYEEYIEEALNDICPNYNDEVPAGLIRGMMYQESGGDPVVNSDGLMQITDAAFGSFQQCGQKYYGETWTKADRQDPVKSIAAAIYILEEHILYWDGDYMKGVQSYNFGDGGVGDVIEAYGDDWIAHRAYARTIKGRSSKWGDPEYLEHTAQYYYD